MEREALLSVLSAGIFALMVASTGTLVAVIAPAGARTERRAWWSLSGPVLAGCLGVAFHLGWALQEPDPADEWARAPVLAVALWAAVVAARALLRAAVSLHTADRAPAVATVGLLSPRLIVARSFARLASPHLLSAALAHEAAHRHHRDPLRIWVAQLVADLQWPLPGVARRLGAWLLALEIARDDEAVRAGADPRALAEAILLAARLGQRGPLQRAASAAGDGTAIGHRVRRLVADRSSPPIAGRSPARWLPALGYGLCVVASMGLGFVYGEGVLRWLPGIIS